MQLMNRSRRRVILLLTVYSLILVTCTATSTKTTTKSSSTTTTTTTTTAKPTVVSTKPINNKNETRPKRTYDEFNTGFGLRTLERRITTSHQQQFFHRGAPPRLPSYAVPMEPLVHYSQRDPLFKEKFPKFHDKDQELESTNSIGKFPQVYYAPDPLTDSHQSHHLTDNHFDENPYYIRDPEPIIEIIIKESNESLPAPPSPPTPPPPRRGKEPVQVFYVKYKKDPNAPYGKDSVIYEDPIPALTPPPSLIDEHEEKSTEPPSYEHPVTSGPPPPTTTLRTIIHPDSETFHGHGLHVTFGDPEEESGQYGNGRSSQEETIQSSAPRASVVFPSHIPRNERPTFPTQSPPPPPPPPPPQRSFHAGFPPPPQFRQPPPSNGPFPPHPGPRPVSGFPPSGPPQLRQPPPPPFPPFAPTPQGPHRPFGPPLPQQQQQPLQQTTPANHQPTYSPYNHQPNHPFNSQPPHGAAHKPAFTVNHPSGPNGPFPQPPPFPGPFQNQRPFGPEHQGPPPQHHFNQNNFQQQHQQQHFNQNPTSRPYSIPPQQQQQQPIQPPFNKPQLNSQQQFFQRQPQNPSSQPTSSQFNQQKQQQQNINQRPNFNTPQSIQQNQYRPIQQQQQNKYHTNVPQQTTAQPPQKQDFNPYSGEIVKSISKLEEHQTEQSGLREQLENSRRQQQILEQQIRALQQQQVELQRQAALVSNTPRINQQHNVSPSTPSIYYATNPTTLHPPISTTTPATKPPKVFSLIPSTSTTTTTPKPSTTPSDNKKDEKFLIPNLPDEVPEDLRQQLLASGILKNADIQILDYDKVGDIPIENLPPHALEGLYGAGSDPVPQVALPNGTTITPKNKPVEMKVVHFNPETDQGQKIVSSYVQPGATQIEPVVLNDNKYNRYLPLKVKGAHFPLPDSPELNGRNITSVVILAPVDYKEDGEEREIRETSPDEDPVAVKGVSFVGGEALKRLVKEPTTENYVKWLTQERNTPTDMQAIILLVAEAEKNVSGKDIFMYDLTTQRVNKLQGELSSAFVQVAEENSDGQDLDQLAPSSQIMSMLKDQLQGNEEEIKKNKKNIPNIKNAVNSSLRDPLEVENDGETEASELVEIRVPAPQQQSLYPGKVFITAGYSKAAHQKA